MDERDAGYAEYHKRGTETPEEFEVLLEIMDKAVSYQRRGVDTDIRLDKAKIRALVKKHQVIREKEKIHIPDLQIRARKTLEEILQIAVRRGAFPNTLLHEAARFSVPKNIRSEKKDYSEISIEALLDEQSNANYTDFGFPEDRAQRDRTVVVTIGEEIVEKGAKEYKSMFESLHIPITYEQCEDIAIAENVAHEHLGHGIQFALEATGETFYYLKQQIEREYQYLKLSPGAVFSIFQEKWARGIEDMALDLYLSDHVHWKMRIELVSLRFEAKKMNRCIELS
jgi:hypothetical protein